MENKVDFTFTDPRNLIMVGIAVMIAAGNLSLRIAASLGHLLEPALASNSFLAVCAHIRRGGWASIVPHTFFNVFGKAPDLVMIDLVQPIHSQSVGLVMSNREPLSPMADAVIASVLGADFGEEFALAATG